MVQITPKNQNKGNKRKSSNLDNDNNQNSGKFRKSQNFANRTPSKGNQSPGNQGSNKKQFNKSPSNKGQNNRQSTGTPKAFNNKGGNKDKPEQKERNNSFNKNENDSDSSEELDIAEILTNISNNMSNPTLHSDEESSSSETEDVVNQSNNSQENNSEESESEAEEEIGKLDESNNSQTNTTADDSGESDSEEDEKIVSTLGLGTIKTEIKNESNESEEDTELSKTEVLQTEKPSNKKISKGTAMSQEHSDRTICIRNMPSSIKFYHLKQFFSKYGKVEWVQTTPHSSLVVFENSESAHKALEVNGMEYQNQYVLVTMSFKGNRHTRDLPNGIFVGSIPHEMLNVNSLFGLFRDCGVIVDISIFHQEKYCAYIWFDSVDAVENALKLNKKVVGQTSRAIIVDKIKRETIAGSQKINPSSAKGQNLSSFKNKKRPGNNKNKEKAVKSGFVKKRQ